jgi:hypothetical protein
LSINNNNNNTSVEPFDGIDQIISNVTATGTLKPKKTSQCKNKDRQKLHGSLPNHLDTDVEYEGSDDTNSSGELRFHFPPFMLSRIALDVDCFVQLRWSIKANEPEPEIETFTFIAAEEL